MEEKRKNEEECGGIDMKLLKSPIVIKRMKCKMKLEDES